MSTDAVHPHIAADEGERLSFMGMDLIWKVTPGAGSGSLCSFIQVAPPGTGVPLHIHHADDECFYLLEGSLSMLSGDEGVQHGRWRHGAAAKGVTACVPVQRRAGRAHPDHALALCRQ